MTCEHLRTSTAAPYEEWCELYPSATYPPCRNRGCKFDKDKRYNLTTNGYE